MRMWSQGLGKMELVVDFSHYAVVKDGKDTVIKGITDEPVQWEFTARFTREDIPGLLNIFFKRETLTFIRNNINYVFRFIFEKLFKRSTYKEIITK